MAVAPSRVRDGRPSTVKDDEDKAKALEEWTDLVEAFGQACDIGRRFDTREGRQGALAEVLFGKATGTLTKRARSLPWPRATPSR